MSRLRLDERRRDERGGHARGSRSTATGEVTALLGDAQLDGIEITKGAFLGLVDGVVVVADDVETAALDVVERVLAGDRGLLNILTGENAPPLDGLLETSSVCTRCSRSKCTKAGSRTTHCSSSRSDRLPAPIRVLFVEDNDVYRDALEFVLGRRDDVSVVGSIADGASAAGVCRARDRRGRARLPAARRRGPQRRRRHRRPVARHAVVFLSASAGAEEQEAARIAGVALVRKDEGSRRSYGRSTRQRARRAEMQLTENTAIVLDSTSDYPEAPSRFPNMRFVPLYVRFGDETYRDYVELGPAEFFEKLRTSPVLPATSQPTPQDFVEAYEGLASYERIYSLHVSAKLSGTFQSAELAAAEIGGDRVRAVDSRTASLAIAMLAHAIQRRLTRGTTDEEIEALVERFHRDCGVVFTLETSSSSSGGGRIGARPRSRDRS